MNVVKAIAWRKLRFRFDWTLTLSALTVAGLGLVNLWTAVHDARPTCSRSRSPGWAWARRCSSVVAAFDYRKIARSAYLVTAVGVVMLVGGARVRQDGRRGRRWFDLGPFHLQPSELVSS